MALSKQQKKDLWEKLSDVTKEAKSIVFVNFHQLKVANATIIRRKLKAEGIKFLVAKKTITKKVFAEKGYEGTIPELEGELGLAYGTDLVAPAREIFDFQKKLKDQVSIMGGVFEGKYMSKEEMLSIATIPPQKTLHAMFVNVINSPIQGFVMALNEIAKKKTA
ncbi:MAG TPA: 50S ribosomal protein L10 [Candidatus Paceibacterota bacterium]